MPDGGAADWPPPGPEAWPPQDPDAAGQQPPPGPAGPPPPPAAHRSRFDQRNALWLVGIVAVVALLVRANRISTFDLWLFGIVIFSFILHDTSHAGAPLR